MHYALSTRTDNPYWRHATQRCDYMEENFDGNVKVNDNYERMGDSLDHNVPLNHNMAGMNYIMAGMGIKIGNTQLGEAQYCLLSGTMKRRIEYVDYVHKYITSDECPSHYQYLLDNIYGGIDEIRDSLEA